VNFDVRPGQCDLCGQKMSYVAHLGGGNTAGPIEACASCLEDAREAIRQQAAENWQKLDGRPIQLEGTGSLPGESGS